MEGADGSPKQWQKLKIIILGGGYFLEIDVLRTVCIEIVRHDS